MRKKNLKILSGPSGQISPKRNRQESEGREWGVGSVVVGFLVFGVPRFSLQRSQNPLKQEFCDLWTENRGAPKTRNPTTTDPTPHLESAMPLALFKSLSVGNMFHLELGVEWIFTPRLFSPFFRLWRSSQGPKIRHKIRLFLKENTQNKKIRHSICPQNPSLLAETSIAKSVTLTRKIRRIHSAETCFLRACLTLFRIRGLFEGLVTQPLDPSLPKGPCGTNNTTA